MALTVESACRNGGAPFAADSLSKRLLALKRPRTGGHPLRNFFSRQDFLLSLAGPVFFFSFHFFL
jgi:hypothetical protein